MWLADLPVEQVVRTSLEREPGAVGILVHGSYATGNARPESDLDLDIFLAGAPTVHYRTWFIDRPGELALHISAPEPEDWAFGLPVEIVHAWVWWSDRTLYETLGEQPVLRKPGADPEGREHGRRIAENAPVHDPRSAVDELLTLPIAPDRGRTT